MARFFVHDFGNYAALVAISQLNESRKKNAKLLKRITAKNLLQEAMVMCIYRLVSSVTVKCDAQSSLEKTT